MAKKTKKEGLASKKASKKARNAKQSALPSEDWGAVEHQFNYQTHRVEAVNFITDYSAKDKITFSFPFKNTFGELSEVMMITNMSIDENGFADRLLRTAKIWSDAHYTLGEKALNRCAYELSNSHNQKVRLLEKLIEELKTDMYVFV